MSIKVKNNVLLIKSKKFNNKKCINVISNKNNQIIIITIRMPLRIIAPNIFLIEAKATKFNKFL